MVLERGSALAPAADAKVRPVPSADEEGGHAVLGRPAVRLHAAMVGGVQKELLDRGVVRAEAFDHAERDRPRREIIVRRACRHNEPFLQAQHSETKLHLGFGAGQVVG